MSFTLESLPFVEETIRDVWAEFVQHLDTAAIADDLYSQRLIDDCIMEKIANTTAPKAKIVVNRAFLWHLKKNATVDSVKRLCELLRASSGNCQRHECLAKLLEEKLLRKVPQSSQVAALDLSTETSRTFTDIFLTGDPPHLRLQGKFFRLQSRLAKIFNEHIEDLKPTLRTHQKREEWPCNLLEVEHINDATNVQTIFTEIRIEDCWLNTELLIRLNRALPDKKSYAKAQKLLEKYHKLLYSFCTSVLLKQIPADDACLKHFPSCKLSILNVTYDVNLENFYVSKLLEQQEFLSRIFQIPKEAFHYLDAKPTESTLVTWALVISIKEAVDLLQRAADEFWSLKEHSIIKVEIAGVGVLYLRGKDLPKLIKKALQDSQDFLSCTEHVSHQFLALADHPHLKRRDAEEYRHSMLPRLPLPKQLLQDSVSLNVVEPGAEQDQTGPTLTTPTGPTLTTPTGPTLTTPTGPTLTTPTGPTLTTPTGPTSVQSKFCEACRNGHLNQVKELFSIWKRNATPGQTFGFGTALHESSARGHFQIAEFLLTEGAEVDALDRFGRAPLQCAVSEGKDYVASLLVCHGADLNNVPANSVWSFQSFDALWSHSTPLMWASARGDCSFVRDRLRGGSNVNKKDKYQQQTALHYACEGSSREAVELLLNAGAHVDVQGDDQNTPLMLAARNGNHEAVKQLILYRADVNKTNRKLDTALQYAAERNHTECGILLVEAGANVHLKNREGVSVLDSAKPVFIDAVTLATSFQTKKAICVVGNALSGKSTLVASLKNEEAKLFRKARNYLFGIGAISQRTTGIEAVPVNSKRFGSVMFFDFAGQQEYHGPHELFFKSILSGRGLSTVTVIVVVKATEEGPAIIHQLNRWLYPLSQASILSASNQVRIIIVASHLDKVKKRTDAKRKLENAYEDIKLAFVGAPLQFVDLVCLNCCKPYSDGIDKLCQYLNDVPFPKYKTEDTGYSIPWIISRIRSTIDDKVVAVADLLSWITRYRDDLPKNLPDADIVCRDLSSTGHFLYMPNSQDLAKGWLVLDLPFILHEVYSTIFSPFSQRRIADQFGLVPVTTVADLFPTWNPDLICGILITLEFAIKVDSTMCREIKGLSSGSEEGNEEDIYSQHLFFPALVSSERANVFKKYFLVLRWLFRVNSQSYITPLILQSIIHCLTTKHVLFHEQGSLSRKYFCRVWYNGIFWQTPSVDVAVQVSDSSVLQVIATSDTSAEAKDLLKCITAVVGDISSTIHNLAPGMSGSSYIICPGEPQALLENPQAPSPLHMFPVDFILDSLKKNQTACWSLMDEDCPATRIAIRSLFCGFEPTMEDISGLLLQPNVKSTGSVESETVDTLPDTSIVKLKTTAIAGHETAQQMLDNYMYKDKFTSDLNSHSIQLHLKDAEVAGLKLQLLSLERELSSLRPKPLGQASSSIQLEGELEDKCKELLLLNSELETLKTEMDKKFVDTSQYSNMKKMLTSKNDQIKQLRDRLRKYEPDQ